MRMISLALVAWATMAGAGGAKTYLCTITPTALQGGYITDVYAFDVNEKTKTIIVDDGVIEYFNKGPIQAFGVNITTGKITFNWDLFAVSSSGQRAKLSYRAVLFLRDMTLRIAMRPIGYRDDFEGYGVCKAK